MRLHYSNLDKKVLGFMEKINRYILKNLTREITLTDEEREKIEYLLRLIWVDGSKFIIMLFVAYLFGKVEVFCFSVICLYITRRHIGGIHAKTYLGCLSISVLYFAAVIYFSEIFRFGQMSLAIFGLWAIWVKLFVRDGKSQKKNKIKWQKWRCVLLTGTVYVGSVIHENKAYLHILGVVLVLQMAEVLIKEVKLLFSKRIVRLLVAVMTKTASIDFHCFSSALFFGEIQKPEIQRED